MLRKIGVKNFKAFREMTYLELKNLNILSGTNSSGKSSIYQALLLFNQSTTHSIEIKQKRIHALNLSGGYLKFGGEEEILNDETNKEIVFYLEWEDGTNLENTYILTQLPNQKSFKFLIKKSIYIENNKKYILIRNENNKWDVEVSNMMSFENELDIREILEKMKIINDDTKNKFIYSNTIKFKDIEKVNMYMNLLLDFSIPLTNFQDCLESSHGFNKIKFEEEYKKKFPNDNLMLLRSNYAFTSNALMSPGKIEYIRPFRGEPQRIYLNGGGVFRNYFQKVENIVDYDYDFEKKEKISGELEVALDYWLVKKLKIVDGIEIIEQPSFSGLEIFLKMGNKKLPITNVGFGVSQIAPIIYSILSGNSTLTILDEPEIHLHPKIQSDLAEFFFIISKLNKKLIIETHSEYLIEKLIYLKIKYNEDNINMMWVERNGVNSVIKEIEHDQLGYILNSPNHFLSEKEKLREELSLLRFELI